MPSVIGSFINCKPEGHFPPMYPSSAPLQPREGGKDLPKATILPLLEPAWDLAQDFHLRSNRNPHKIFVWDSNGVYMDCWYPNPQFGHFLNRQSLKGECVVDVFSCFVGRCLQNFIQAALQSGESQRTQIMFERKGQNFEATIDFFPSQEGQVFGLVRDRPLNPDSISVKSVEVEQTVHLLQLVGLTVTHRQFQIVQDVMKGWSNDQISKHLGITERTVKSHLHKIYGKLGVVNRIGLLVCLAQAGSVEPPHVL